jgi:chloramphenicol-sensitive protein RarD
MNRGIVLILLSYLIWGCFPIYWSLLNHVNPSEVLLHRIVWSLPILFLLAYFKSSWWKNFKDSISSRKELLFLVLTATLITINWGTYILAVNLGRVVEGSMGYFLVPIINMLGGYIFFHERVSRLRKWSILFATVGSLYYIFSAEIFPWLGFILGFSFSFYGLARKAMKTSAVPGLYIETLLLLPVVVIFAIWMYSNQEVSFMNIDLSTNILLILAGFVTVIPLVFYTLGIKMMSMTTSGILFFINPSLHFLIGYFLFDEYVDVNQLIGFFGVWIGLVMYSYALIKNK